MNDKNTINPYEETGKELEEMNKVVFDNVKKIIKYLEENKVLDITIEKIVDEYYKRDKFIGNREEYRKFLKDNLEKFLWHFSKKEESIKKEWGVNKLFESKEFWEEVELNEQIEEKYSKLIYLWLINPFEQIELMDKTWDVSEKVKDILDKKDK